MSSEIFRLDYPDDEDYLSEANGFGEYIRHGWGFRGSPPEYPSVLMVLNSTPAGLYVTSQTGNTYSISAAADDLYTLQVIAKFADVGGFEHSFMPNGEHVVFTGNQIRNNTWMDIGRCRVADLSTFNLFTWNGTSFDTEPLWGLIRARLTWDGDLNQMTVEVSYNRASGSEVADYTYTLDHNHVESSLQFLGTVATDTKVSGFWGANDGFTRRILDGASASTSGNLPSSKVPASVFSLPNSRFAAQTGFTYCTGDIEADLPGANGYPKTALEILDSAYYTTSEEFELSASGGTIPNTWTATYRTASQPLQAEMLEPDVNGEVSSSILMTKVSGSDTGAVAGPASLTYSLSLSGGDLEQKPNEYYTDAPDWPGGRNGTDDGWVVEPRALTATLSGHSGTGTNISIPFNDTFSDGPPQDVGTLLPHFFLTNETFFEARDFTTAWKNDVTLTQGTIPTKPHISELSLEVHLIANGAFRLLVRTYNTDTEGNLVEYFCEFPLIVEIYSRNSIGTYWVSADIFFPDNENGVPCYIFRGSAESDDGISTSIAITNDITSGNPDETLDYGTNFWSGPFANLIYGGTLTITPA